MMGAAVLIAAPALFLAGFQDNPPSSASPEAVEAANVQYHDVEGGTPHRVGDVVVTGYSIQDQATAFVGAVAAPSQRRGIARWRSVVCVGVANLRNDIAIALADHVSRVAVDVGLRVGSPGCTPNVVIIFADDARALASTLVERDRKVFRLGVGGLDRGNQALTAFQLSERPVRWWHVSMPIVASSGARAIRMPGDAGFIFVPGEGLVHAGRPVTDALNKVIIIVDADQLDGATLPQLGDYLALVSLLQVDPNGDTRTFATILNLFDDPQAVPGLSEWDRTYLASLYGAYPERINPWDQAAAMSRRIVREWKTAQQADPARLISPRE